MPDKFAPTRPKAHTGQRRTLATVVGFVTAGLLLTHIPADESGATCFDPEVGSAMLRNGLIFEDGLARL